MVRPTVVIGSKVGLVLRRYGSLHSKGLNHNVGLCPLPPSLWPLPYSDANNNNNNNASAIRLLNDLGTRISSISGDTRETSHLYQRVSVLVQRFSAVLLHDSLPVTDCTDWASYPFRKIIIIIKSIQSGGSYYCRGLKPEQGAEPPGLPSL